MGAVRLWLGAIVSICANMASVVVHHGLDALSLAVSAWPPVALLVVVEIMAKSGHPKTGPAAVASQPGETSPDAEGTGSVIEAPAGSDDARSPAATLDPADVAAVADMIGPARDAAAELNEQGRTASRETLTEKLRERGHAISNARASTLVKVVKAGTPS